MGMIPALNKVDFPFHTMLINILGAVIIGMIVKFSRFLGGHERL